jgi:hypothetical protein
MLRLQTGIGSDPSLGFLGQRDEVRSREAAVATPSHIAGYPLCEDPVDHDGTRSSW